MAAVMAYKERCAFSDQARFDTHLIAIDPDYQLHVLTAQRVFGRLVTSRQFTSSIRTPQEK